MRAAFLLCGFLTSAMAVACADAPRGRTDDRAPATAPRTQPERHAVFFPRPLADDWTAWILGDWEGTGEGNAGKGKGALRYELDLGGQFLVARGQAEITGLDPDYLRKQMNASDEEVERFRSAGYGSLELYTLDPETGEVIAFLFDSLRCVATGRGRREGNREAVEWHWRTGHRSTRITERLADDRFAVTERTAMPDGSVMEDRGEMVRVKARPATAPTR